jgi:superfamily II RNA helicase
MSDKSGQKFELPKPSNLLGQVFATLQNYDDPNHENQQITMLTAQRQQLRNKSRSIQDDEKLTSYKGEISDLTKSLKELRREVWLCNDIQERSEIIAEKSVWSVKIYGKAFKLGVVRKIKTR